jgi:mRNA-degrading endonuclease RelE of RelBE toxin-antitoxin system
LPYSLGIREHVNKIFLKIGKKDKKQMELITKKVEEICENPSKFKPLHSPKQNLRRVHVGSFVIVYSMNEAAREVTIEDYAHHDDIYE